MYSHTHTHYIFSWLMRTLWECHEGREQDRLCSHFLACARECDNNTEVHRYNIDIIIHTHTTPGQRPQLSAHITYMYTYIYAYAHIY